MNETFRFIPLEIALSEIVEAPARVQVLRTGSFQHPQYGALNITPAILLSFKSNFDAKVRGIDISIDYSHNSESIAAGWIKGLELMENGSELWASVEWTKRGSQVLAEKEFRYLSADFTLDYKDNETLKSFGPTLLGAGLTNRPVVKRMSPTVELSEVSDESKEKNKMDMEKDKLPPAPPAAPAPAPAAQPPAEDKEKKIAELEAKCAEMEKKCADLAAKCAEYEAASAKAAEDKALSEKKASFDKLMSEGKVCEAQREAFMSGDAMKLAELSQSVKLGEAGSANTPAAPVADAQEQVITLAQEKVKNNQAKDFESAVLMVLSEKPELAEKK